MLPPLSPRQYRILVESSPMMIWRAGLDAKCDYFNETWLAFTGRTIDQELGDGWTEGVHPDDLTRCVDIYRSSFEARVPFEMEYRLRRHDGVYRYIFDRGVPFSGDDGRFGGYIGSCVDVHERREADRQKARFLSMLAHELRTPLTSMRAYVEGLRRRLSRGQPIAAEPLDRLAVQIDRFAELVRDMSDVARLEAGRSLPLDVAPVDLAALAREGVGRLVEQLRFDEGRLGGGAGSRKHTVELQGAGAPAPIRADRRRLAQVLTHLLENAVKYSPHGGTIRVTLEPGEKEHALSISDQGIGVPPAEIASLGRPYFRTSNASSSNYPGLGLGLAVAREVVARHGGRIWFESRLGHGTTAHLALPAGSAAAVADSARQDAAGRLCCCCGAGAVEERAPAREVAS